MGRNDEQRGAMEVTKLMQQLVELDQAAQRSVAAEVESALEPCSGDAACLADDAGRARILEARKKGRPSRARRDEADKKGKPQQEPRQSATGQQDWQAMPAAEAAAGTSRTIPR